MENMHTDVRVSRVTYQHRVVQRVVLQLLASPFYCSAFICLYHAVIPFP